MPRFITSGRHDVGDTVRFRGSDARHIARVLRLGQGDELQAGMPSGSWAQLEILEATQSEVVARVVGVAPSPAEPLRRVVLAQALVKGSVMDSIVEKASELGVEAVVPFTSRRCVALPPGERRAARLARWRRIADESRKQCGRTKALRVADVADLQTLLSSTDAGGTWLLCSDAPEGKAISEALGDCEEPIGVVIGPEGGFTEEELTGLQSQGARLVSLGRRVLRCETAAVAVCALVLYHLGELRP